MEESVHSHVNNNQDNDNIEVWVQSIMEHLRRMWYQIKTLCHQVLTETGAYDILDKLARMSAKHPFLALGIAVSCIVVSLPFLVLLLFALSTIVMTFTGFIFLEGTLITAASVLLFGCLGAVLIVLLFFGGITITGYFGFMHIYDLFSGLHNKAALMNFLKKEKSKTK